MAEPHQLTDLQEDEVFKKLQRCYSDFLNFQTLVAPKLKQAISDSSKLVIDIKSTKDVFGRYYQKSAFKTKEQKENMAQLQLIFKACYVLILSYYEENQSLKWTSREQLLEAYPEFQSVEHDEEEIKLLLNFRNMVKLALKIIPANLNKQTILKIAGRLEGSHNEYITGGGQRPAVTRRVLIYEREGNVEPVRSNNSSSDSSSTSNMTSPAASVSVATTAGSRSVKETNKRTRSVATVNPSKVHKLPRLSTNEVFNLLAAKQREDFANAQEFFANPIDSVHQGNSDAAVAVVEADDHNHDNDGNDDGDDDLPITSGSSSIGHLMFLGPPLSDDHDHQKSEDGLLERQYSDPFKYLPPGMSDLGNFPLLENISRLSSTGSVTEGSQVTQERVGGSDINAISISDSNALNGLFTETLLQLRNHHD